MYCLHCKINWERLEAVEGEGDEQYEVCPVCNTDSFLTDTHPGDTFIYTLDGKILNLRTGERAFIPQEIKLPLPKHRHPKPKKSYEERLAEREEKEDKAIAYYLEKCDHDIAEAQKGFFENFK